MRFLVTPELGRLARWLRLLGYDTAYASVGQGRQEILIRAMQEQRTILARDRRFKGGRAVRVVRIQSERLREQLKEVIQELRLVPSEEARFTRCLRCNASLEKAEKASVASRVPPYVFQTEGEFVRCPQCDQIFWPGTHMGLAEEFLKGVESRG